MTHKKKHKDDYIIHKTIKTDEKSGTVTLNVVFRVAEHPRGANICRYNAADALRWLNEGGIKVGTLVKGCKTSNYVGGMPAGTRPSGQWVFKLYEEPKKPASRKKAPAKKKNTHTKRQNSSIKTDAFEDNSSGSAAEIVTTEFAGLNYDGDTDEQPELKEPSKPSRKRKKKKEEV